MKGMNKGKKEIEKNGTEKRKETNTIERHMKDKQRVKENTKEEKRERDKNRKWCLKSAHNGTYNNGEQKGIFCSKRETIERNEKERKVLWEEKEKWWTRKRTRKMEIKELRQRWLFLKKNREIKTRSRKNWEKTHLKEDDSAKTMFTKSMETTKKKTKQEKRQKNKETQKKETRDEQKGVRSFDKGVQKKKIKEKEVE